MFISKGWLVSQRSRNAFFSTGSRKRPQSKAEQEHVEHGRSRTCPGNGAACVLVS